MFRKFKRIISFLLISTMILTMVPEIPAYAEGGKGANLVPTIESDGQVTFYYKDENASSVYVKGSWDWSNDEAKRFHMTKSENGFWRVTSEGLDPGTSYEYGIMVGNEVGDTIVYEWINPQPNTPGNAKIIRNPNVNLDGTVTFYYYPSMGENASDIKVKYTGQDGVEGEVGFAADAIYTSIYSATTEPLNGTYDYFISVSESGSVSGGDLYGYNSNTSTFTVGDAPKENPDIKSPVVDKGNVTFNYYAPLAKEVKLAGSMTDWGNGALPMGYDSATGYWSITLTEQRSGEYQYKFIDGNYILDPLNESVVSGNSAYTVTDGFVPDLVSPIVNTSQVTFSYKGAPEDNVVLIGSMNGWQREGVDADKMTNYDEKTGVWSITKRLAPGKYEYKFFANGTDINDPLNTTIENTNSVVTVQNYYTYNIYYYDTKHTEIEDTSLWIWEDGGTHDKEHFYSSKEVIDDYTWLKAEVDLPYTKLGVITKSYTNWDWQESDRFCEFTGDNQQEDIYIIFGDPTIYTECPDLSTMELPKDRYIMIEYTRDNGDYADWNVYTWNSGYGDVSVPFEEVNGRWIAIIPVTPATSTLNFCVRRSPVGGDAWAEKDGGDHAVTIADNQTVAKARMTQGKGVEETLPSNIGFEIKPNDKKVMFYYRDDNRFLTDTQKELEGKVQIGIDMPDTDAFASTFSTPQLVEMTYDEKSERFQYTHESLTNGEHSYYYIIDGDRVLDSFNSRVNNAGDANIYDYYTFNADFTSKLEYPTMDYNDNNLLSITMNNPAGAADALKVVEAYADLSQLGGGITAISPELMELSISVLHTTSPGTKAIPVVVKDQYGNEYKTETTVEVKAKSSDDFDWDEAIIYFTLTDRFFDGDSGNNNAYNLDDYNIGEGGNLSYHGGDFAGLIQKLDYLQEMGVNTVWITPIIENYMADGLTTDDAAIKSYGYHGYWASDFEKLNKHLGTEAELSALVKELHNRDMKLMVDVVLNHSGYDTDDTNVTDFFNNKLYGKKMLRDNSNTTTGHDVLGSLAGLPDFVTEDAEVRDLLIEWQTSWVSKYDIDYFRVDTVKHVEDTTWAAFKNALVKIDPDFKMIGEQSGAGYATPAGKLGNGLMDSLLDFDFNDKALDFVTGKMSEIESFMQGRNAGIDNTATMGSFLGSHDEDGFLYRLEKERNMSPEDSYDAMKLAASLQITAKGQPVIYYGEEVGQTGANNYPIQENRYDFDWSLVNDENTMLAHYKTLLEIRGEYSDVFAKGNRTSVAVSDEKGYDVFQRSYEDSTVIVALQSGGEQQKVTIKAGSVGDTLKDVYNDTNYTVGADGNVEIKIPSIADGGTAILQLVKKEAEEKPSEEKPTEEKPSEEKPGTDESGTQKPKPGDSNQNDTNQNDTNQNNSNQEVKTSVEESNDKKSPVTYDFSEPQNSRNMLITTLIMVMAISCATGVTTYLSYRNKETEE